MDIQDKLTVVNQRYKELERYCQDYIKGYDHDTQQVRTLKSKYSLAGKTLDLKLRLRIKEKMLPLERNQKQGSQEYMRQKRLESKIQIVLRDIDFLKIEHENIKRMKAQEDGERQELIRVQKSIENYDRQYRTGLRKMEEELDRLWRVSKSNEFVG